MELPDTDILRSSYSTEKIITKACARKNLIKAILQAKAKKHIYIYAPPRFGKTASVLEWLKIYPYPHAWISLNEADNDSHVFFLRLALSFLIIQPNNITLMDKLRETSDSENAFFYAEIAAQYLSDSESRSYTVLDGFENIKDAVLIQDLIKVIRVLPGNCSVVVISQHKPHSLFADLILRDAMSVIEKEKLENYNPRIIFNALAIHSTAPSKR